MEDISGHGSNLTWADYLLVQGISISVQPKRSGQLPAIYPTAT